METRTASAGVLVVDDQAAFRATAAALVAETHGLHVCRTAASVIQARSALATSGLDVVLLDIRMPGEDALGFAAWVRRVRPELVVVLVSAYGVLDVPISLLAAGVGFVAKEDLAPASLLAAIAAARAGHPGDALR
ncbi:MAG TPA: response regulator [Tetrasphaera sp.]|uniref:response regulator n=1 Tax=Nostocoides sp. TaxID=1917966 RepID=UPI002BA61E34|nr:response regulator [Tetrasphaera sp.]HNQ07940.1 response regulator [Tetrasphaera sp.]